VKVVDCLKNFTTSIYLQFSVEYAESYDFYKFAVSNYQFQNSVNTFSFGQQCNIA
jgi:hypothetical protein